MADKEMTSVRLDGDVLAALRKHAEERGETLSDTLRRASLMVLGKCPTCGQAVLTAEAAPAAGEGKGNAEG